MKRSMYLLVVLGLLTAFLTSCATARWKPEELSGIHRGQSSDSVIRQLGQPDSTKTVDGVQEWIYRNPTESKKVVNSIWGFYSFGIYTGKDCLYVDILTVKIKNGKVVNTEYSTGKTLLTGAFD